MGTTAGYFESPLRRAGVLRLLALSSPKAAVSKAAGRLEERLTRCVSCALGGPWSWGLRKKKSK